MDFTNLGYWEMHAVRQTAAGKAGRCSLARDPATEPEDLIPSSEPPSCPPAASRSSGRGAAWRLPDRGLLALHSLGSPRDGWAEVDSLAVDEAVAEPKLMIPSRR